MLTAVFIQAQESPKAAKLKVTGYGLLGNRELQSYLRLFVSGTNKPVFFDANFIEDGALLLLDRTKSDGYLAPALKVQIETVEGHLIAREWTNIVDNPLPRPVKATRVEFEIIHGVLYSYEQVSFRGLNAIPEKKARAFFYQTGALLPLKSNRIFTEEKFKRSMQNLEESLRRLGYEQAEVKVEEIQRDPQTGKVKVSMIVSEGPLVMVRLARIETHSISNSVENEFGESTTNIIDKPYSRYWLQDFIYQLKLTNYHRGYPETKVQTEVVRRDGANPVSLDLLARVMPGPQVRIASIKFDGHQRTRETVLASKVPLKTGDWLDRTQADQGRFRLSKLGAFRSVELEYEALNPELWNVTYHLKEAKRIEVNLLAGFGSYELLRGGVEVQRNNLWGRGHQDRLRIIQSMKSSSVDYLYTMPEFFGKEADFFLNSSWLDREEPSFTRQEFGGGAGVKRQFKTIQSDVVVRYLYEVLNSVNADTSVGPRSADVGAAIFEFRHDRQDNPLYPRKGFKVVQRLEGASDYLGGDVNYQKVEMFGSLHHGLWEGQWMHYGIAHGVIHSGGDSRNKLPFGKRFFPGGDTSIRGFRQGEASPRNADGKLIGAEVYLGGNVEFEQSLTEKLSLVTFLDAMGVGAELDNYPFNEWLISVGAGLRWKTILGPVRLEYGYNLRRRVHDPQGAIHFSVGFPF